MHELLERASTRIQQAAGGMTPAQLQQHSPGKWCAAEVMEHLSLTYESTAQVLERHLESGEPAPSQKTLRERLRTWVVIGAGYMPGGLKAPVFAEPKANDAAEAWPRFQETLARMDAALARCEQEFGSSACIASHFAFGPLTANQWRKFHWVHTRHHAPQIRKLRAICQCS